MRYHALLLALSLLFVGAGTVTAATPDDVPRDATCVVDGGVHASCVLPGHGPAQGLADCVANGQLECRTDGHTPYERTLQCLVDQVKDKEITLVCPRDGHLPFERTLQCVRDGHLDCPTDDDMPWDRTITCVLNGQLECPTHGHTPYERTLQCLVDGVTSKDPTIVCPRAASAPDAKSVVECVRDGARALVTAATGGPVGPVACHW